MESRESINDYHTRVTYVVDQMKMYIDEIKEDVVDKILSTVTEVYDSTVSVKERT